MTTESNRGRRRKKKTPKLSQKSPVARSGSPSTPTNSSITPGGGRTTRKRRYASIPYATNCRRSKRGETHLQDHKTLAGRGARRQQPTRSRKTTRRSCSVSENKEEGRLQSTDTRSDSLDLHVATPSSRASEVSGDVNRSRATCQPGPPIQSVNEIEVDEADLRHRALRKLEEQEKKKASDRYQQTGDMSVFAPFMAPFIDGPDRTNLGSWIWDSSMKRWRREHKLDGRIIWGPTEDSFI